MMKFALKAVTFGVLTAGSTMVMAEDAPSFTASPQLVVWLLLRLSLPWYYAVFK